MNKVQLEEMIKTQEGLIETAQIMAWICYPVGQPASYPAGRYEYWLNKVSERKGDLIAMQAKPNFLK